MIRDKIIRRARPILFIGFLILLGCAGMAEAQSILSDSIRDILSTEQIDGLKANEEMKNIKRNMRTLKRATTSAGVSRNTSSAMLGQQTFIDFVKAEVGKKSAMSTVPGSEKPGGIESIFDLYSKEPNQKEKLSDPDDPDGLAVRFAPSDDDLF